MTYEQALARAFLNIITDPTFHVGTRAYKSLDGWLLIGDFATATLAMRRLRVRAGLVP